MSPQARGTDNKTKQMGLHQKMFCRRVSAVAQAMGLAVSLQCQDAGLIPGLAQCVKVLVLPQLHCRHRLQLWLRSDPWPQELHVLQGHQNKIKQTTQKTNKQTNNDSIQQSYQQDKKTNYQMGEDICKSYIQ